jgi:hypothetical protein
MFLRFFPDAIELSNKFAELVGPETTSMASIQGHLLRYNAHPEEAIAKIDELLTDNKLNKS